MKKNRIILALVICMAILGSVCINGYVNTYNLEIDDVIGNSTYTNVRTFINGNEIQSYAIGNYIFVAVEDLADYYFIVNWNENTREFDVERDMNYVESEINFVSDAETGKIGDPYLPILFTDIKVNFEGNFLRSYNVDGKIAIYVDDLAAFTGADYSWNGETKELHLDSTPYYIVDPLYQWSFNTGSAYVNAKISDIYRSFMYKFKNKTDDDGIKFNIVRNTGDYGGVSNVSITGTSISFTVSDDIKTSAEYWESINAGANVVNGGRISEDTHERRIELFDTFKIYINDEIAGGELEITSAGGLTIYSFRLDVPMEIDNVDTVLIQVG